MPIATQKFNSSGWLRGLSAGVSAATTAPSAISLTAPSDMIKTSGWRGIALRFFGDTANDTMGIDIFAIERDMSGPQPIAYRAISMFTTGNTSIVIGTTPGIAGGPVLDTELYADAVDTTTAFAPTAFGTHRLNYIGGTFSTHSPADNTIGEIAISDLSNVYGLVVQVKAVSVGATNINYAYKLDA